MSLTKDTKTNSITIENQQEFSSLNEEKQDSVKSKKSDEKFEEGPKEEVKVVEKVDDSYYVEDTQYEEEHVNVIVDTKQDEKVEEKVKEKVEAKVQEQAEAKTEEQAEEQAEEKVDNDIIEKNGKKYTKINTSGLTRQKTQSLGLEDNEDYLMDEDGGIFSLGFSLISNVKNPVNEKQKNEIVGQIMETVVNKEEPNQEEEPTF